MRIIIFIFILTIFYFNTTFSQETRIRKPIDTIGFASKPGQMDMFMSRVMNFSLSEADAPYKTVISPHDDYAYVGYVYPELLSNIRANTIILFGVCHKAKLFNLENKIIFDTYTHWQMPYGNVKISSLREDIIANLPPDTYIIHDSIQALEHSVEAIVPFLQYNNRNVEIISILVPYMPYEKMNEIAEPLAKSIFSAVKKYNMNWGNEFAMVISSDAVHYGDEDWGGKNYAPFGADSVGYKKAIAYERDIITTCLIDKIEPNKINKFISFTVDENNYKEYKWTWCGRYSVPFGLFTSFYLQKYFNCELIGEFVDYATSLDHPHVPVLDLGMGVTAPANIRHWVGYSAIGYK